MTPTHRHRKASKQPIRKGRLPYQRKEMSRSQAIVDSARKWRQDAIEGRYDAAARDNDFARVHAPVLERGAILTLKGGLFSAKRAVVLRVTGDTLLFLDQASVEAALK